MKSLATRLALGVVLFALGTGPASAQNPAQRGRLIVTVNDTTGGFLPTATVTVTGIEAATRAAQLKPLITTAAGIAIFDNLAPGRYTAVAEFTGFKKSSPKEVRVRAGDNRMTVVLELAGFQDTVTVGRDREEAGSDRGSTFGTMLTREQIDALSDDPATMRQQLEDLAGPGASFAVDSFEGGQLPNKSQIRSIRISRDQFAAESHYAGGIRLDIVTQPGSSELRGGAGTNYGGSALDGRNPLVGITPPSAQRGGNLSLTGTVIKDRMSFSLFGSGSNNYTTPVQAASGSGGTGARALDIRQINKSTSFGGSFDYALTKNQTLRFGLQGYDTKNLNSGAGLYDGPERTSSGDSSEVYMTFQHTGPIGRRVAINNRLSLTLSDSSTKSALEAVTLIVPDDLNRGGAQRRGGTDTATYTVNSDVDYVRGRNSFRGGLEMNGTRYHSNQESNYLGTYFFESPEAFLAGRPRSFTKRIGDPDIRYSNVQVALYFQDDVRLSKTLTMTPGLRYEVQTHVKDYDNFMPRFGFTWAPAGGKTTYRASLGIFHDWLGTGIYQQSLQVDGFRLQEVNIPSPSYPDPGPLGAAPAVNRYLLADDLVLPRTARASLGISRTFNTRLSGSATYAYTRSVGQFVGENLNAPVNGVRPDPTFANVIRAVSDGRAEGYSLGGSVSMNLAGLGANPLTGPFFQWRRALRVSASYTLASNYNNTDGAFSTPAVDLASDWGPSREDIRHRGSISLGTGIVRGLSASLGLNKTSDRPLGIRTGTDDNGDLIFNNRPVGVGRNSARIPSQWNSSASFGYSIPFGSRVVSNGGGVSITSVNGILAASVGGAAAQQPRYRLSFNANISNVFNRPIWSGYSGVITSKTYLKPVSASGVRTVRLNANLSF